MQVFPQGESFTADESSNTMHSNEFLAPQLEAHVAASANAVNTRDFSRSSPGWNYMAPKYRAKFGWIGPFLPCGLQQQNLSLEESLEMQKDLVVNFPEFRLHVIDMFTEVKAWSSTGEADVYMNMEVEGIPPGVVKRAMSVTTFKFLGGKWQAVECKSLDGSHNFEPRHRQLPLTKEVKMRLVNIHTLKLQEFVEGSIPPYAILSHRWTDEELTFKELAKDRADKDKKGYRKLLGACQISAGYGVDYIWCDTCCIDKRSSAELSESINSMFAWYQKAKVCLAYLEDVHLGPDLDEELSRSVWFTRSWTLQELLAPGFLEFYDHDWVYFGSRSDHVASLSRISGIDRDVLIGTRPLHGCSVCKRMSWAADRHATRSEDIAYSLMGIFNVNMPLLYGEGSKAFERLQEEILRRSSDKTILSWGHSNEDIRLLARCPADFRALRGLVIDPDMKLCRLGVSNVGLEVYAKIMRWGLGTYGIVVGEEKEDEVYHVILARKMHREDNLYKIDVEKLPILSTTWYKTQTLMLVWGNEEQARMIFENGTGDYIENSFRIQSSDEILVQPEYLTINDFSSGRLPPHIRSCASGFVWDFGDPIKPAYATLTCNSGVTGEFSVYLTFGFDSRPFCLVFQDAPSDPWEWYRIAEASARSKPRKNR
ncbi:hypothetical protein PRZ48_013765 [Zasmidium cellare]|uniref:Heterokaryon incompatibility domain-containing protein n=1 Tax=Zasmidium cellare TaxID=395010 RepID=A0ABR0E278_ZASCE|nr:hypothetical protein PRZ48_013765 [Zasmidium cellare]